MPKLSFVDTNEKLVLKVKKLFENYRDTRELDTFCWDVFEYQQLNPEFKIATASNPQFTMWAGLDKAIAEKYPQEIGQLREFWITDNLFWLVSVDENIKTDRARIRRCLAGVYAHRYIINIILTGIWTGIWWLSEEDFISELSKMLSADLRYADLRSANLRSANLSYANLSSADLSYANLYSANLSSADLSYAKYNEWTAFFAMQCPEEGAFIWRKKLADWSIAKLQIPARAKRSSATSRKCRAEYVKTLWIWNGNERVAEWSSKFDTDIKYTVWEITHCDERDEDRRNECSWGIHFFLTRWEAEQW